MIPRAHKSGIPAAMLLMLVASLGTPRAWAISPLKFGGAVEGRVSDDSGRPQMGAAVQLFNRQDKLIERKLTDDEGFFSFAGLMPDVYSVRVTLATFLPAIRNQLQVYAGKSSLLDVSLSGLFSSIHVLPAAARGNGIANDDWKWVLRSSSSTRPIFRYLPQPPPAIAVSSRSRAPVFTDSRGLVQFSAGDSATGGSVGEMGTAFAFATSVLGANQVQFAGDVGYGGASGVPSAAFRSTFSRAFGSVSPEISVTMRQLFIPRWAEFQGAAFSQFELPPLRTMSISAGDRTEISDRLALEYGAEVDSVSLGKRQHYFSPYARMTWILGAPGKLTATYTSGNARPELGKARSADQNAELQRDVSALGSVPAVTLRSGDSKVQRGENYEIAYSRGLGSGRQVRVSGYRERVQNASLMLAGSDGNLFSGDLIPDIYTDSLLFNAGNYSTMGYTAAITQGIGDNYEVTVMYGSVGVLAPRGGQLFADSPDELRSLIHAGQRQAATLRASGSVPRSGTRFVASYQIMDNHAATPGHLYSTDSDQPEPGLNLAVRQPVPAILGLPFRMEATVDIRNLLAEGYLPISLSDGRRLLLVHTPRSLRGGVSFRF